MKRLLAKSADQPDAPRSEETLQGHTACVLAAADLILVARGAATCAALGQVDASFAERLFFRVRLGAFLHDLGKCAEPFQRMVRGQSNVVQPIRHEAASFWLGLPEQPIGRWLLGSGVDRSDLLVALAAAAGHHRKFPDCAVPAELAGLVSAKLLCGHDDFRRTLELGARALDLRGPIPDLVDVDLPRQIGRLLDDKVIALIGELAVADRQISLPAVKALVLDADVAGSAMPRSGKGLGWIAAALAPRDGRRAYTNVVEARLAGKRLRPFQQAVAAGAGPLVLVNAGCGTGKTIAAYAWAAEQHPARRLWITYPTTGTATEGFRDYVCGRDLLGRLDHSRVEVDIEMLSFAEPGMPLREFDRIDALRAWEADAVLCTVDTVLGLVQNQRKGLYAFTALVNSAVVFDEIHAYDDRLFGALLRFLTILPGIPGLLMTASLPAGRLLALQAVAMHRGQPELPVVDGPSEIEQLPRYRLSADEPWEAVERALAAGQRVMWVCNTVGRCMEAYTQAKGRGLPALCYHSRYTYRDRVARHGAVIDGFQGGAACLAVTTQVAEMSLDLSADLLLTDLAPIPALIQRLGRLNRRSTPDAPRPVRPFVVIPFQGKPYENTDLEAAAVWLGTLDGRDVSQRDLIDLWHQPAGAVSPTIGSAWIDGGFGTMPDSLREDGVGITVLREADAAVVAEGNCRPAELALPMGQPPRGLKWQAWRRRNWLPVAPKDTILYDSLRGAEWAR